ncbi:hypothetical protein [Vibrio furnissii]|uniref:hypothetical protein n=2 Tax=Vibrio TaxID=662 RepID=UPI001C9C0AB2|nr:hypothetical protein [Vibrio furnissii]MBY7933069.1 hypothetical protein [Vibrio fluvialis]MCG6230273.1 hypothetical protein [Vibrio furnissii]MCG6268472.1 hypothetical protein [Vibrio furnissii]
MNRQIIITLMLFSGSAFAGFSVDGIDIEHAKCSDLENQMLLDPVYFSARSENLPFTNIKEITLKSRNKNNSYLTAYCNTDNDVILSLESLTSKADFERVIHDLSVSYGGSLTTVNFLGQTTKYRIDEQLVTLRLTRKNQHTIRVDAKDDTFDNILLIKESDSLD